LNSLQEVMHVLPRARPAAKRCASRKILLRCAALVALASCLAILNACSGFSTRRAGARHQPPIQNAGLSISSVLPSGTVEAAYKATLGVSGGTAPYLFSLASGQLPTGVLLNAATGTISGTPTVAGSFSSSCRSRIPKAYRNSQALQISVANLGSVSITLTPAVTSVHPAVPLSSARRSAIIRTQLSPGPPPKAQSPAPVFTPRRTLLQHNRHSGSHQRRRSRCLRHRIRHHHTGFERWKLFLESAAKFGLGEYGQGPPSFIDCSPSPATASLTP